MKKLSNEFKYSLKKVLDMLPVLVILGVITGFGSYTTILGALLTAFLGIFFNSKLIYAATISAAIFLGTANIYLGGRFESLSALLFTGGVFLIIFSIFKKTPKPNREASLGFLTGVLFSAFALSIPLAFGLKTFSSVNIMQNFLNFDVNENALAIAFLTLGLYYYLSRVKWLPAGFLAFLGAAFVCFLYKIKLPSVLEGFIGFNYSPSGDFGNFPLLVSLGFLFACLISSGSYNSSKTTAYLGISNIMCAFLGYISGGVFAKTKTHIASYTEIFIFAFAVFLFGIIGEYFSQASACMVLMIKSCEILMKNFKIQKYFDKNARIIWFLASTITIFNVVYGLIFAVGVSLMREKFWIKKLKQQ